MYGQTALSTGPVVANAEGGFEARLTIPANATAGNHPIVAVVRRRPTTPSWQI